MGERVQELDRARAKGYGEPCSRHLTDLGEQTATLRTRSAHRMHVGAGERSS